MTTNASGSRGKTPTMSFSLRLVTLSGLVCLFGWFPGVLTLCHAWVPTTTQTAIPMRGRSIAGNLESIISNGWKRTTATTKPLSRWPIASAVEHTLGASSKNRNRRGLSFSSIVLNSAVSGDIEPAAKKEQSDNVDGAIVRVKTLDASAATTTASSQEESSSFTAHKHYSSDEKFANLVFLSVTFGYALYTLLSIDGGMTRGWSAPEIAMRIPLDNWGAYESYLANKPIVTKSLINVIIYLLGDWLSQTAFQSKNLLEFDISRTLRNGFIGLCFGPVVHEYYEFSDAILPPENGLMTRLQKILMDQTIYLTVKCSIYICAVGLLAGEDWDAVRQTVRDKIGGIISTAWRFWPLVHCVTYSVIPAQHRVLWVNSVDLVWNAILSSAAQQEPEPAQVADNSDAQPLEAASSPGSEPKPRAEQSIYQVVDRGSDETQEDAIPLVVVSASAAPVIVLPEKDDASRNDDGFLATALRSKSDFGGATNTTASETAVYVGA